jgi:hypothetical protein
MTPTITVICASRVRAATRSELTGVGVVFGGAGGADEVMGWAILLRNAASEEVWERRMVLVRKVMVFGNSFVGCGVAVKG